MSLLICSAKLNALIRVSMRFTTYYQSDNLIMARKVKVMDDTYSALEMYCIGLNEYYKALRKAGFSTDIAMAMIMDKPSYPDWLLPTPINFDPDNPDFSPYEDDED